MSLLNEAGFIGILLVKFTNTISGNEFITLLSVTFILLAVGFTFRLPLEVNLLFLTPLILVLMSYNSLFFTIGALILFFEAVLMTRAIASIFS